MCSQSFCNCMQFKPELRLATQNPGEVLPRANMLCLASLDHSHHPVFLLVLSAAYRCNPRQQSHQNNERFHFDHSASVRDWLSNNDAARNCGTEFDMHVFESM